MPIKNWIFIVLILVLTISLISCHFMVNNTRDRTTPIVSRMYMELRIEPSDANQSALSNDLSPIIEVLRRRINALGVGDSLIGVSGNIIKIEMPGYRDIEQATFVIRSKGELRFIDENNKIIVTNKNLKSSQFAYQSVSKEGTKEPFLKLTFDEMGTKLFADGTKANIGKKITILLDDQILMSPKLNNVISDGTVIITFDGKDVDLVKKVTEYSAILQGGSINAKVIILKAEVR